MLVLSRKIGEEIVIGHCVRVRVVNIDKGTIRLGVIAPDHITVNRDTVEAALNKNEPKPSQFPVTSPDVPPHRD